MRAMTGLLDWLLEAPTEARDLVVKQFPQPERNEVAYHWGWSARPAQLPPPGDWRVWMVMAGRGFGKTRTGAEWVRAVAERDPQARIALVSSSLADARTVMIEGETGILACSPPDHAPVFEPSLKRLRLPNGAQALLYSAAGPRACADRSTATLSGQAQKEFFVNEAHLLLDALVHACVHGIADIPPAGPVEGNAWLVQPDGQGDWSGKAQTIAVFTAGGWRFLAPQHGMLIFDKASGRFLHFDDIWKFAEEPTQPVGGATVDLEARATIGQLILALREHGLLPRA